MSRLRKKIAMDMGAFQGTINQTSQKGREILKTLEDFKFTLEQTARLLNNNQELAQGMIQKRKSVDEISNKLYQIVFDIENMDISNAFENQNQPVMQDNPVKVPGQEQPPAGQGGPNMPGIPGQEPGQQPGGAEAPSAGGPAPGGGGGGGAPTPGGQKPAEDKSEDKGDDAKGDEGGSDEKSEDNEE